MPTEDAARKSRSVEGWDRTGNIMVRLEEGDIAVEEEDEEVFVPHDIHEMQGLRLVGGVDFINRQSALFCDLPLRQILNSDERWRAYLQFREEAFQIAATELVSSYNSPVDLIELTDADRKQFLSQSFEYIMTSRDRFVCGVDNISKSLHLTDDVIERHENNKKEYSQTFVQTRRYFAYRKSLLKLDFIQSNSNVEYVLERLKSSGIWSELGHRERKCGLESHLNLLKELENTKSQSQSEFENLALEKINLELGSELQKHLDDSDCRLMNQYYNRKKLMNLARECAIQADATGYILCEEALPVPSVEEIVARHSRTKQTVKQPPEAPLVRRLPSIKQAVKRSLEGSLRRASNKFRSARGAFGLVFLATAATVASAGISNRH